MQKGGAFNAKAARLHHELEICQAFFVAQPCGVKVRHVERQSAVATMPPSCRCSFEPSFLQHYQLAVLVESDDDQGGRFDSV